MIIQVSGHCAFEGCEKPAEFLACGEKLVRNNEPAGHPTPACYCREHMEDIIDEDCPEYRVTCPNCGCRFGVN